MGWEEGALGRRWRWLEDKGWVERLVSKGLAPERQLNVWHVSSQSRPRLEWQKAPNFPPTLSTHLSGLSVIRGPARLCSGGEVYTASVKIQLLGMRVGGLAQEGLFRVAWTLSLLGCGHNLRGKCAGVLSLPWAH